MILTQIQKRDAAKPNKAKGKAKAGKGKGKGNDGTDKAKADKDKVIKTNAKKVKLPCYGFEWSRGQIMCRAIGGKCFAIKFSGDDRKKADKEANAWLNKEKKMLAK